MLKEQFTFPQSLIATHAAALPFEDPICHQLPPQPLTGKSAASKSYLQSFSMSGENSKGNYIDFTLGNSPQYSNTFQPQILLHPVSKFNKKGESPSKKYTQKQYQPQKQQNIIRNSKAGGNTRDISASKNTDQMLFPHNDHSLGESKTERQSKQNGSRVIGNSSVRQGGNYIHNQATTRNPRQDSIYLGDNVKKKFMNKAYPMPCSRQSPDKMTLINRIQQLKSKLSQAEGMNKTLGMQLQGSRQKFKVKDAQNHSLREKMDDLGRMYEEAKAKAGRCANLEGELIELKKMNDFFCEQIDKLKMQIVQHEEKNQQSLRLLQKLNENITKREQKLQKQLSEQIISFNKLSSENIELEQRFKRVSEVNSELQGSLNSELSKNKQAEEGASKYVLEIQELKRQNNELISQSKVLKNQIGFLKTSLAEENAIKSQLLMDLGKGKQQNSRLKQSIQQLSDQKAALISDHQLKLSQTITSYEQKCSDWKKRIDQCQNKIEGLFYENKQYEMKLQILNQANDENLIEIKDLKQQKKMLYIEKEELKSDVKHLIDKNDKLLSNIEAGKKRQIQLNNTILERQSEIIALQQRITENITEIANKDITIKQLSDNLESQLKIKQQNTKIIHEKTTRISELQEKLRKYEHLLAIYKQEINKIKENKETQWQQMKEVYEEQIIMLQEKLKEFITINEKRAIRKVVKIGKQQRQKEDSPTSQRELIPDDNAEPIFQQISINPSNVQCFSVINNYYSYCNKKFKNMHPIFFKDTINQFSFSFLFFKFLIILNLLIIFIINLFSQ